MVKTKKPNIGNYLKEHKLGIFFYLFFVIIASSMTIFMTIIAANALDILQKNCTQKQLGVEFG